MDANSAAPEPDFLDNLRRRRAELLESARALEQALAAPMPGRGPAWAERVHVALVELWADFREHLAITEGADGLYREIIKSAPRLSGAVDRLTREHAQITGLLDALMTHAGEQGVEDVDRLRELGTTLLVKLVRHRQHGSDLVHEAYQADIGGET